MGADSVDSLKDFLMSGARTSEFPSAHIPGYELVRVLGQGSLGRIYLARDEETDNFVALKLMRSIGVLVDFQRESQIGLQLDHPHIVKTLRYTETAHGPCCVQEYCNQGSVRQYMEQQPDPFDEVSALAIARSLLGALQIYAHARSGMGRADISRAHPL